MLLTLPAHPFDYLYLMDKIKDYARPRDKIRYMLKKGDIIRVKKGIYMLSPDYGGTINYPVLANLIYGPSYISLEYALSYRGLIPERVTEVTSMTSKRNRSFKTPAGIFSYRYLHCSAFSVGVDLVETDSGSFYMATREKALCDTIAMMKHINDHHNIYVLLKNDLRLYMDELETFNVEELRLINSRYKSRVVNLFVSWFEKEFRRSR